MGRHPNSIASLRGERDSGRKARRCDEILAVYSRYPSGLTDREVLQVLRLSDMNQVRPAIQHFLNSKELYESGKRRDPLTGKTVRVVSRRQQAIQQDLF